MDSLNARVNPTPKERNKDTDAHQYLSEPRCVT